LPPVAKLSTKHSIIMSDWSDLGDILTSTRESLGWSIEDVSHRTRIPQATLCQLEKNDYSKFPSLTYARSFLAQYCDHLDIDAVECLAHFETGDSLADLNACGYLKDHDERVNARPLVMKRPRSRKKKVRKEKQKAPGEKQEKKRAVSSSRQPLVVFSITSLLLTCAIFTFMKLSDTLEEKESVTREEPAETLGAIGGASIQTPAGPDLSNVPRALLVSPEGESSLIAGEPGGRAGIEILGASPSSQANIRTEFSLDNPPPRAVIVEE
tara:strand:+ start:19352 stop:20155 length:804 start_codon:yes stop_codon:yes gene_type:complete